MLVKTGSVVVEIFGDIGQFRPSSSIILILHPTLTQKLLNPFSPFTRYRAISGVINAYIRTYRSVILFRNDRAISAGGVGKEAPGRSTSQPHFHECHSREQCLLLQQATFLNCLLYANDMLGTQSIALPAISAGLFAIPMDIVGRAIWHAIETFDHHMTCILPDKQ